MSDYTPTTAEVRLTFARLAPPRTNPLTEFDRWLAQHDAEVRKQVAEEIRLIEEWVATDHTSVELEQWPSGKDARRSREAAEAEFIHDGDDVLLHRFITPWRVVVTGEIGGAS